VAGVPSGLSVTPNQRIKQEVLGRVIAYFSLYDTGHIENDAPNNSSIVACVFVTAVTILPSRCLATIGGIHRHTHRQQRDLISLLLFIFYFFQNKESSLKTRTLLSAESLVGLEQGFLQVSLVFPLLTIIPSLLHTHLSPLPEVCDSHDQAAHYHIHGL
jgi:hypothetical protein